MSMSADGQIKIVPPPDTALQKLVPEVVYYTSDSLHLKGYLYKPSGKGPFPVFMWNHDSEKNPDSSKTLASFWVKQGFIFFKPIRSGHSDNSGVYIVSEEKQINRRREMAQLAFKQTYKLHQSANKDVMSALYWIKHQPYADSNKIVVAGAGYGGLQVLLTAEKVGKTQSGIKCFIAMAPVSTIWYKMWADSLVPALSKPERPIFLMQAHNDYSIAPCETLGPVLEKKGQHNRYKIFPNHTLFGGSIADPEQGHSFFFNDTQAWEKEVLKFLKDCGVKRKKK